MNVPPAELAAVALDRRDAVERLLDDLRKGRSLEEQKEIIRAHERVLLETQRHSLISKIRGELTDSLDRALSRSRP